MELKSRGSFDVDREVYCRQKDAESQRTSWFSHGISTESWLSGLIRKVISWAAKPQERRLLSLICAKLSLACSLDYGLRDGWRDTKHYAQRPRPLLTYSTSQVYVRLENEVLCCRVCTSEKVTMDWLMQWLKSHYTSWKFFSIFFPFLATWRSIKWQE